MRARHQSAARLLADRAAVSGQCINLRRHRLGRTCACGSERYALRARAAARATRVRRKHAAREVGAGR